MVKLFIKLKEAASSELKLDSERRGRGENGGSKPRRAAELAGPAHGDFCLHSHFGICIDSRASITSHVLFPLPESLCFTSSEPTFQPRLPDLGLSGRDCPHLLGLCKHSSLSFHCERWQCRVMTLQLQGTRHWEGQGLMVQRSVTKAADEGHQYHGLWGLGRHGGCTQDPGRPTTEGRVA